jgi:hypothetical protein
LNLALQALALRRLIPEGSTQLRPGRLIWTGWVQPTAETSRYQLRVDLKPSRTPSVRVLAPALKPNHDGLLPHVYDNGTLCLSRRGDWAPTMYLVDTFLPWACEWLTFYELWLATDLWYGDGPDRLDAAWQASILHPYS